eukprot:gene69089-94681_t
MEPPSPSGGLRPAMASLGLAMPKRPVRSAAVMRAGKAVADRKVEVGVDGTVRAEKALARQESLQVTLKPAPGRIAALRVEALGDVAGETVTLNANVRGADGKLRKVTVAFADATAKTPRYRNGVELQGIGGGWKFPMTAPTAATPLVGVWLLAEPVMLAEGESLVVALTGEAKIPLRVTTSPLGAGAPLDVANEAVRAALLAQK